MSLVQVSIAHNKEKRNEGRSDIFVLIFFTWIVKEVDPFPFRSFLNPDVGGGCTKRKLKVQKDTYDDRHQLFIFRHKRNSSSRGKCRQHKETKEKSVKPIFWFMYN